MLAGALHRDRAHVGAVWGADLAGVDPEPFENLCHHFVALARVGEGQSGHAQADARDKGGGGIDECSRRPVALNTHCKILFQSARWQRRYPVHPAVGADGGFYAGLIQYRQGHVDIRSRGGTVGEGEGEPLGQQGADKEHGRDELAAGRGVDVHHFALGKIPFDTHGEASFLFGAADIAAHAAQ